MDMRVCICSSQWLSCCFAALRGVDGIDVRKLIALRLGCQPGMSSCSQPSNNEVLVLLQQGYRWGKRHELRVRQLLEQCRRTHTLVLGGELDSRARRAIGRGRRLGVLDSHVVQCDFGFASLTKRSRSAFIT